MIWNFWKIGLLSVLVFSLVLVACDSDEPEPPIPTIDPNPDPGVDPNPDPDPDPEPGPVEVNITNLLANQIDEVIIPTYQLYQEELDILLTEVESFVTDLMVDEKPQGDAGLENVRESYEASYIAYQAAALHNYFATANSDLVNTTNLYPIDLSQLDEFIAEEAFNFNVTAQRRANGFPALDYLLYGNDDILAFYQEDPRRLTFLQALVTSMKERADLLVESWTGSLRQDFVDNGGVELGSSVSVQLNSSIIYYEEHIRENKVGIPIGRIGPNDTPIEPDATKIEGFYQSLREGNGDISLVLLRASIEEMEDLYLGTTSSGEDDIGYDDLLRERDLSAIDTDIQVQFEEIYNQINNRSSISGDEELYNSIQGLITLYKSDLFPVLNVQDADGSNDGD